MKREKKPFPTARKVERSRQRVGRALTEETWGKRTDEARREVGSGGSTDRAV
jgi:hypothetical protein